MSSYEETRGLAMALLVARRRHEVARAAWGSARLVNQPKATAEYFDALEEYRQAVYGLELATLNAVEMWRRNYSRIVAPMYEYEAWLDAELEPKPFLDGIDL